MNDLIESLPAPVIIEDYREATGQAQGPHLAKIRGVYNAEGARSRNRRTYQNIAGWVNAANESLTGGSAIPMYTSHEAAHRDITLQQFGKLTRTYMDGNQAIFEGYVANTTTGREALTLIEGGYVRHISQRLGQPAEVETLKAEDSPDGKDGWEVIKNGRLIGIDITNSPGLDGTSITVAESAEGAVLVESFDLEADERDFNAKQRDKAVDSGAALPDGSFPIYTQKDLENAVRLVGHAKDPAAARAHIKKRANALGLTLPDGWEASPEASPVQETLSMEDVTTALADLLAEKMNDTDDAPAIESSEAGKLIEQALAQAKCKRDLSVAAVAEALGVEAPAAEESEETEASEAEETSETLEAAETDDASTTAVDEALDRFTAALTEAGRAISKANMGKLKAAHDALNEAAQSNGGAMLCPDPDHDGESAAAPVALEESTVAALVETRVTAALTEAEERFNKRLKKQQKKYEEKIDAMLKARRKSSAATGYSESTPATALTDEEIAKMTPEQKLKLGLTAALAQLD